MATETHVRLVEVMNVEIKLNSIHDILYLFSYVRLSFLRVILCVIIVGFPLRDCLSVNMICIFLRTTCDEH